MYYLRFTNTATEDLERGTSIHCSDLDVNEITKSDAAEMFGCEETSIDVFNNTWAHVLDGLCGYALEAKTLDDAIEEVNERTFQFDFVGRPVIFKGRISNEDNLIPDGDLFIAHSIEIEL
jgi:hypothetical protein